VNSLARLRKSFFSDDSQLDLLLIDLIKTRGLEFLRVAVNIHAIDPIKEFPEFIKEQVNMIKKLNNSERNLTERKQILLQLLFEASSYGFGVYASRKIRRKGLSPFLNPIIATTSVRIMAQWLKLLFQALNQKSELRTPEREIIARLLRMADLFSDGLTANKN